MFRSIDRWLAGYLRSVMSRSRRVSGTRHLMFCIADHFEPFKDGAKSDEANRVVREWASRYPRIAREFRDSDGCVPRHTFFYPAEDYDAGCLDSLGELCSQSPAEVEIQLHHRNDTPDGFRSKLAGFRDCLRQQHGLLGLDGAGNARYGFVHGNWALCNSRPDGDWCGVNEELGILRETGCYGDFTFPSAPSPTQSRMVNAIYYASDMSGSPRGHDRGTRVRAGRGQSATGNRQPTTNSSSLMLIQGPLTLDWKRRKWGILPRLENSAISGGNPPSPRRVDLWARQAICVIGRPEWVFIKVHTHGCVRENMEVLLGDGIREMHRHLVLKYGNGDAWRLHYTSAREMYNIVRAAEDGKTGNPGEFRDYEIAQPM